MRGEDTQTKTEGIFIQSGRCVWTLTKLVHSFVPSCTFTGPPTRSEQQQQRQRQRWLTGVRQPHDQQKRQSADVLPSQRREGLGRMFRNNIHSSSRGPTGSLSNVVGTSRRPQLLDLESLAPLHLPIGIPGCCALCFLTPSTNSVMAPAQRATQIQQLPPRSLA